MKHPPTHKALLAALFVAASWSARVEAQGNDARGPRISPAQIASIVGGASLSLIDPIFDINRGPPSCAPCDPEDLPSVDRWVVRPEQSGWNVASSVGEVGVLGATWYELARQPDGMRRVAASVEAVAWTMGLTQVSKALINRNRPVLYTEDASEAMVDVDSHRSMPSGHTSLSFAAATFYALEMDQKKGFSRYWPLVGAAGVGAMRMLAARHFTTDVLAGAALGAGSAIVFHAIRF